MKILFPTDYSEYSTHAFAYAVNWAKSLNAQIDVFHVFNMPPLNNPMTPQKWSELTDSVQEGEQKKFQEFLEGFKVHETVLPIDDVKLEFSAATGNPIEIIAAKATEKDYDFIIMGTKGSDNSEEVMGSVTTGVMDRVEKPLLAVPLDAAYKNPSYILIAEDLEEDDREPLAFVFKIADTFDSKVAILHISELKDYNNPKRVQNYNKIKYEYARGRENLDYLFERGMNKKVDTLEHVAEVKDADLIVLICRDDPNALKGKNGMAKATIAQLNLPVLAMHSEKQA